MSSVDFISNFHISRYIVDDIKELKRHIGARLDRNDIEWGQYDVSVNGRFVDENVKFDDGDVVRMVPSREREWISNLEFQELKDEVRKLSREYREVASSVITRPFFDSRLKKPDYAFVKRDRQYVGVYACSECGGPLRKGFDNCHYCGFYVNWSSLG